MNILLTSSTSVLRWRNFNSNGASIFPGRASVKTFNRFYHDEEAVGRFPQLPAFLQPR
jgi:hypothetical protein